MQRLILILFIASELCYYLLIAQTGVVEYFSSNLFLIAPLPVGGIICSHIGLLYILIRKWLIITEFHAESYSAWQCSRLLLHVAFL